MSKLVLSMHGNVALNGNVAVSAVLPALYRARRRPAATAPAPAAVLVVSLPAGPLLPMAAPGGAGR